MDNEKDDIRNVGGDGNGNVVMDVDGVEVEMGKPQGGEKEVLDGTGAFFDKAGLEGHIVEETDVSDVKSDFVKEMGDCGNTLPKGGEVGREVPFDSYMEVAERDEESEKTSDGTLGLEVSMTDGPDKKVSSNGLTTKSSLAKNIPKEEIQNEGELVKVGESNKELLDATGAEKGAIIPENEKLVKVESDKCSETDVRTPSRSFLGDLNVDGYESGTEEEQMAFLHEIEVFFQERGMDFKPPKFYQEQLNLLKLWRWVIKLGGYEKVSLNKLWRQVGESFKPPKTCTTVSWSFRVFYEKALLDYEKHKILSGELPEIDVSFTDSVSPGMQGALSQPTQSPQSPQLPQPPQPIQASSVDRQGAPSQPSGIGRVRRDAAARAMQGWHSLRASGNDELGDPIIKDKSLVGLGKREKQNNSLSLLKRSKLSPVEHVAKVGHLTPPHSEHRTTVVDIGPPSDYVKINVQRTKDCFEVYVLVPGLSREEVRVQSDPAGRLVISGHPEHLDNPWGVAPFKKVVTLPSRIDPHQTSAVVTLHGQLFVRAPFEQSDS